MTKDEAQRRYWTFYEAIMLRSYKVSSNLSQLPVSVLYGPGRSKFISLIPCSPVMAEGVDVFNFFDEGLPDSLHIPMLDKTEKYEL